MRLEHCPLNLDNPVSESACDFHSKLSLFFQLDWQFSIDGNVYKSNYSMISEKCRERLKAKYFIVNRSQLARINTKVLKETGKKWVMHVDSLKDFQSYTVRIFYCFFCFISSRLDRFRGRETLEKNERSLFCNFELQQNS